MDRRAERAFDGSQGAGQLSFTLELAEGDLADGESSGGSERAFSTAETRADRAQHFVC